MVAGDGTVDVTATGSREWVSATKNRYKINHFLAIISHIIGKICTLMATFEQLFKLSLIF